MRVGMVGLGMLGWPMAANVVKAGHEVMVHDRDREKVARFAAEHDARAAAGPGDLAENEVVVTITPTGQIVRNVLTEEAGGAFIKAVKPGTVVIDMGSSDPLGTRALGAILRKKGVTMIDAPVSKRAPSFVANASGATPGAATGTLVLMLGCDDKAVLEKMKPLLFAMGDRLFEMGSLGTGHAIKALNNYASAATHIALGEAMLIGERFGLDMKAMIDVINESTGRSFVSETLMRNKLSNPKFNTGFTVGLLAKDTTLATALARAMNFDGPMVRLTEERWAAARDRLGYDTDLTEAVPGWDQSLSEAKIVKKAKKVAKTARKTNKTKKKAKVRAKK